MNRIPNQLTLSPDTLNHALLDIKQIQPPIRKPFKPGINYRADTINDLFCFSHLRWKFVYQRPQHLLSRATRQWRVWYIEEPIYGDPAWNGLSGLDLGRVDPQLTVVTPHLPHGLSPDEAICRQRMLLDELIAKQRIQQYASWYYTPMALPFSDHLTPRLTVYDCMDELSAFLGAPTHLLEQECRLLKRADVVFTGGLSLYEAKQKRHSKVFAFPSCIDYAHFAQARSRDLPDPADQAAITGPRIGYSGVIDERLNLELIADLAQRRPEWQFIFLGPVVKINPDSLPQAGNIHYLGMKSYNELPAYFSNWNVAMMPFAINEATRFISPTKTPEYLAAGLPVISTPIRDVVRTYGCWEQVVNADSAETFESGISLLLRRPLTNETKLDAFLQEQSWENTWHQMERILTGQLMQAGFDQ